MKRAFAQITLAVLALIAMLSLGIFLSCKHEPNGRNEEAGPGALHSAEGTIREKQDSLDGHCVMSIEFRTASRPVMGKKIR